MAEMFIRERGVTFDLTRIHVDDSRTRVAWALRLGIQCAVNGAVLTRILQGLSSTSTPSVAIADWPSEITALYPRKKPTDQKIESVRAAGQAFWIDQKTGLNTDYAGPPTGRTQFAVLLGPLLSPQSAFEYLWHELLHLVTDFTHSARQGEEQGNAYVDEDRWDKLMNQIADEIPKTLTDPITNKTSIVGRPFASSGCATCARIG